MKRLDANGNQKLTTPRVFTQAQWPPATPYVGEVVQLADTYGNLTFSWMLEYRPDLDSTYPWRIYNGSTATSAVRVWTYTGAGYGIATSGSWTNILNPAFIFPLAGTYSIDWYCVYYSASGTLTLSLGTASGNSSNVSSLVVTNSQTNNLQTGATGILFTATKGQNIYYNGSGSASATYYAQGAIFVVRPIKVAAA